MGMTNTFKIRKAEATDVEGIARMHMQSWKETYPGIMPEARMNSLDLQRFINNWKNSFSTGTLIFVAECDGAIIGLVSGGTNRPNEGCETGIGDECDCEMAALYILQKYHKQGLGRLLFDTFSSEMFQSGYKTMVIWVAKLNPATGFYAAMGGKLADAKIQIITNEPVPVLAYTYTLRHA